MLTLHQYLRRELYGAVLFVTLAFLALFSFFDMMNELGQVGQGQYRLQHAALVTALTIPVHLYELLPLAALIGAIYVFARLANQSEFTIMRASGMSTGQIIGSILRHGIILVFLTYVFGEVLAPPASKAAESMRSQLTGNSLAEQFRSGVWLKDTVGEAENKRTRFINIGEVLADRHIENLRIFEFDAKFRLEEINYVKTAKYLENGSWLLGQLTTTHFYLNPQGVPERAEVKEEATREWQSALNPELLSAVLVRPNNMAAFSLFHYIRHLAENNQKTHRFEIAFWRKVTYPFAVFVMLLLALPFAYLHFRAGGVSLKIFVGVMLGVTFHLLSNLFSHIGLLNTWSPLLSATLPSLVAMVLALGALRWVERH